MMRYRPQLLLHPLRNGRYVLVSTVSSRNGLMFKHVQGIPSCDEVTKELAVKHFRVTLTRGAHK